MKDSLFYATLMNYAGVANGIASLNSTGKVPTAQLPASSILSGAVVQMVSASVKGFTTTNGNHAGGFDNKPITSTEGSGFGLTVNMKPTATANRVFIMGNFYGDNDTLANTAVFWGLFLAGSSSAVIAGGFNGAITSDLVPFSFHWQATTVSTATTSYAVRLGSAGAATFTLNGQAGAGLFANSVQSSLTVWEIQN